MPRVNVPLVGIASGIGAMGVLLVAGNAIPLIRESLLRILSRGHGFNVVGLLVLFGLLVLCGGVVSALVTNYLQGREDLS